MGMEPIKTRGSSATAAIIAAPEAAATDMPGASTARCSSEEANDCPGAAKTPSTTSATLLFLRAVNVILNNHTNGIQWFDSTVNLQLASVQLCSACRYTRKYHVRVPWGTPQWMWAPALRQHAYSLLDGRVRAPWQDDVEQPERVPALRVRGITWGLSTTSALFLERNEFVAGLENVVFGDYFNDDISGVVWPRGLKRLKFGREFNRTIRSADWPASLRHLTFGNWFNQALESVVWPTELQTLSFGDLFNMPVEAVVWPPSLLQLSLGFCFNQPIAEVAWPASLESLTFGHNFNQPLDGIVWPSSLRRLTFGHCFDRSLDRVQFPPRLQDLSFGKSFDRPIDVVAWPASLRQLSFGHAFNQDVEGITWPPALRRITLGDSFDRPLGAVNWPSSLAEVAIMCFRAGGYSHSLAGVRWPAGLRVLTVRWGTNLVGLSLPPGAVIVRISH
eukprot:jgi/Undpi1/10931/HiC_scaffold_3.g01457.m1